MKSGGPVNPVSPQRAAERDTYDDLRDRLLRGPCQVCGPLRAAAAELLADGTIDYEIRLTCGGRATELHHRRKRSSAGALTNPANVLGSCHDGNMAVEAYPLIAKHAGMVVRHGHPEWEALSARAWRKAQLVKIVNVGNLLPSASLSDPPGTVSARPPAGPDPF